MKLFKIMIPTILVMDLLLLFCSGATVALGEKVKNKVVPVDNIKSEDYENKKSPVVKKSVTRKSDKTTVKKSVTKKSPTVVKKSVTVKKPKTVVKKVPVVKKEVIEKEPKNVINNTNTNNNYLVNETKEPRQTFVEKRHECDDFEENCPRTQKIVRSTPAKTLESKGEILPSTGMSSSPFVLSAIPFGIGGIISYIRKRRRPKFELFKA